jgi:hypothetical protein
VFDRLDFVYMPSRDAAADVELYTAGLGGELVFAIERFGTRVAMVRSALDGPALLLAEHLEGDAPILIFRVDDLEAASAELGEQGVELGESFGMPFGSGVLLELPGPQRLAVYERKWGEHGEGLTGRRDF